MHEYVAFTCLVKGLSHSRPTNDLEPVDLMDAKKTEAVFASFAPDWVIHCAAERRPDVAEKVRSELMHFSRSYVSILFGLLLQLLATY